MSQSTAQQCEAGPSSSPLRYDPAVRRSKTVGSTHSRSNSSASTTVNMQALDRLTLPIQLSGSSNVNRQNELRDPFVSPTKRGETLRAYSRHRRVFSGHNNDAPTSPEQMLRSLSTQGPVSPSMRRVHPSRNPFGSSTMSDSIGAGLLFPNGADDTDMPAFAPMHTSLLTDGLGDEPSSSSFSSTPSLTSPTSTLSRSTSVRSAGSDRINMMGGTRFASLNASADLPTAMENLSPDYASSNWSRRARRWSNSMSRRMSISALNNTIHSTTSPYLKAGLQELRSIFDVDTLGLTDDDHEGDDDLEYATPVQRRSGHVDERDRLSLFGIGGAAAAAAASRDLDVFESPDALSPVDSRHSTSEDRELPQTDVASKRPTISFKSQAYEAPATHRRNQSWRKHRSLDISDLPNRASLMAGHHSQHTGTCSQKPSSSLPNIRENASRSQSVHTPLVAVGLAAMSITIIGVCAFETTIHPDAASLPLTAFMLAQSLFALVGISGLALQRRWVIDLASRLIRAHVLCQVLIALAALRSLSRTAFYRDRVDRQAFNGTAAAGMLTSSHLLAAPAHKTDPHGSSVGSFRDQVTYLCVFLVQAALPLAFVLWAQYSIASALSRATRHLPASTASSKQHTPSASAAQHHHEHRHLSSNTATTEVEPRKESRMRFNSVNPTIGKGSTKDTLSTARSEGWLGFAITRLDAEPEVLLPSQPSMSWMRRS